ncbi:MAG: dihydrolipoyllysine-residue succinyltransferase, partial [Chloroflexaceae bacterium]|nr:dihydrolipoyllysine-residue succinyltransferase [Chloroflexaceae bacterium]
MATEVRVPVLGESIVEATISKWLKKEGESVAAGEPIVELETDKVNLEVAAEQSGVLNAIVKGEGETVAIDDVLAMIGEGNGVVAPATNRQAAAAPAPVPNPTPEVQQCPNP